MFLAVKKFWKVIFGSCSNCKIVDVKNRSHDSPGAWERFILGSQTTGVVYDQHIMGNHLNLACLVSGLLFPCPKEAIKALSSLETIHPASIHHTTHHHSIHNPAIHSSSSCQNLNSEERKRSPDPLKEKKCEATRRQQLGD